MLRAARVLLAAVVLSGAVATAGVLAAPAASQAAASGLAPPAPTPLPPDLLALVEKMEVLQVSSERLSLRTLVSPSGAHLPGPALAGLKLLDIHLSGVAVGSPPTGNFALTRLGRTLAVRLVGEEAYVYEPAIARRDGGRPWVDVGQGIGSVLGGSSPGPVPTHTPTISFAGLAAGIRGAREVSELGPGHVDGQAVYGFRAMVDSHAADQAGPFATREPASTVGAPGASPPSEAPALVRVEIFIAANGLPVQTRIHGRSEGLTVSAVFDIFATDRPVSVHAPPASKTIGAAALRRITRRSEA